MRIFKVILIIILVVIVSLLIHGTNNWFTSNERDAKTIAVLMLIGVVLGLLGIVYHIMTFRYYRKSKKQEKPRKIPIILWFGIVASSIYILLFGVLMIIGITVSGSLRDSEKYYIYTILIFLINYGIGSLVEASLLDKRIKKQYEEMTLHNEIDDIGN